MASPALLTKVTKPIKKAEESISGLSENDHSPTVEESKDIDEKNVLKYMIESAMVYLQRSLAIMIKSVMSRLYGTTEILQKLHELDVQLQRLPKKSVKQCEVIASVNEIVQTSCKFWKSTSEAENCDMSRDWVWHCRQMLPRKKDPQEEWKELSEDLKSWKLDVCFKLISRATHDGVQLFASQYLCFKTPSLNNYNFIELAENATKVRNFYAHPSMYKDIIKQYAQDFGIVEDLAVKVFQWVKNEDNNPHNLSCCQENVQHIQKKKKAYLNRYTAKWEEVSNGLKKLNFNDFAYILLATPCTGSAGVGISKEELAQLSNIPWAAIFDFDIASRQDGLWHSLCELEGDHLRLKVSCQSSSKNTVVPFSYADIDEAKKVELCRDGHIPWIFPHGELLNKSNEACPLNDCKLYQAVVLKPLIAAMRKIVNHITQNSSQGTVSVILCYGSYARDHEKLPYKNFLSDLRYLCGELTIAGGHVIVLSDSLYLVKFLEPQPVLIFPLEIFCKMIQNKLTFGQGNLPPVNMPTSVGLRPVTFEEEDFELIHEHIAEHEFYKHQVQEIIELRQQEKQISDSTIRSGIYYDLRKRFYKGQRVTWISLNADHAITRREEKEITRSIRQMLQDRINEKIEPARYVVYHSGGAGATTLARKILWNLRTEFPCIILKSNYKHSDGKIQCTSQALKNLYEELQYPILMLIDEEPSFKTIPCLTSRVQANGTPVVFLQVQRFDPSESAAKSSKDSYILPNTLHKDDANNLKHKFLLAFGMDKISAGDRSVAKIESSLAKPAEGDQVTDFTQHGIIAEGGVAHKRSGLSSYYEVKVIWDDGKEETCHIGPSDSKKYRLVYLITEIKTEINRLYQTFHFYGIMYLDEDFRKPMYEHIKKRLSIMLPDKKAQDDTSY